MDPPQALSEKRNSSCSASCRRWVSEAPGAKGRADPKPRGLWRDAEDNGTSGAPNDLCDASRGPGCRRSGRRRRHRSATKDREEGAESIRWEGRAGHEAQADAEGEPCGQAAPPSCRGAGASRGAGPALSVLRLDTCRPADASHPQVQHVGGGRGAAPIFLLPWLWDLSSAQASVRTWGQQLWRRMAGSLAQAGHILHSWGTKACQLLWMLCTLLLLLLGLGLARLRLCWCGAKGALLAGVGKLGGTRGVARLLAHLDAHFLHRTWTLFKETRTCKYVWGWLRKGGAPLWDTPKLRTEGLGGEAGPDGGAPSAAGDCQPGKEVARLLAMAEVPEEELDPFQVLGLEVTATDAELKKAYRRLAVLVHPDKNEHPRAEEAFKVLRAAWDVVSNPEKRKEYELKRMAESELSQSMNEFLTKLQDDLKEAMNTMMCSRCQGKHKRFELDRDPLSARYCADCGMLHPAEEGDFWAESSLLGLKITYFAVMDRKVYDITEWAGCQRVPISPNTHRVPYHISFGSRSSSMGGRQRASSKGSPASAADLQDFFSRIFQGSPGPMSNGGFFNPPQPPPPGGAATPPKTDGAAPKGDAKPKRRKKVRRPFHR